MRRSHRRFMALAMGSALPLLLMGGAPGAAPADDTVWMRVEVHRPDSDKAHVKISLPLSLIEVVDDSIDKRELIEEFESEHPSVDLQKMWKEVRRMETDEFLTVESDHESVRVWKDREFFRVNIKDENESNEPVVKVQIPLDVMDYLFEKSRSWDFQQLVDRVRPHLPLTLVEVNKGDEYVKIWLGNE